MIIKNIAFIAHVDHGKTSLLDVILRFSKLSSSSEQEDRIMDSNDLEKERGITILSKNTAIEYQGIRINLVDTPGHSDFGGEVERVLSMVDGCLLLVDAQESVMPQTRFVLRKALQLGHKIILVVNKIDKPNSNPKNVIENVVELFLEENATDEQLEFPIIFSSAKENYALKKMDDEKKDITPLLDTIIEYIQQDPSLLNDPFKFQVTTLDYDDYLGRICIGRIFAGKVSVGDQVSLISQNEAGQTISSQHKVTKLFTFLGLNRIPTSSAASGDIIALAGISEMTIGDTLTSIENQVTLPRIKVEPPTVSMEFKVNDSPFAGREGKFLTSRQIRERLLKEAQINLSLKVVPEGETFSVSGRGQLHLAILIENMRREGYEFSVLKPKVIIQEIDKIKNEPYEKVLLEMPQEYSGGVIQELNRRKGLMLSMDNLPGDRARLSYEIPTRGLIGFRSFYLTETRGNGILSGIFIGYRPIVGDFISRVRGALISMTDGVTSTYALYNIQERGELFLTPQIDVYEGMIVGLHSKEANLTVNPVKEKKLTNMRASGSDESLKLTPPRHLSLEQYLDILDDDEMLEITPTTLRLRKKILKANMRKGK